MYYSRVMSYNSRMSHNLMTYNFILNDICRVHIQWEDIELKPVFYIMNLKPNSIWEPEKCPVSMSEIVLVCCCILKISLSQHQITAAYWCQEWTTQMGRMISGVKNFGHKTLGQNYDFSYLINPRIINLHNLQWKFIFYYAENSSILLNKYRK